jgi:HK97 family phage major capsid protein
VAASVSSNSTLTRDEIERILIQPLRARSTFLRDPRPIFTSNGEPIKIPTLQSFGTAAYVAEGSAVAEVSPVTSEIELLPSTVWSFKSVVKVTSELMARSFVDVEAQLSQAMVADVAVKLDYGFYAGSTATPGAPVGLFNMTGFTNAGTVAGTALAKGNLIEMTEKYIDAYADEASAQWVVSPANWTRVQKFSSDNGTGILQTSLADGAPRRLLGYPVTVTPHAPDTEIVLHDRGQVAVGHDVSRDVVRVLDQTYAANDLVGIMVQGRWDVQPMNAAAIVKLNIT